MLKKVFFLHLKEEKLNGIYKDFECQVSNVQ